MSCIAKIDAPTPLSDTVTAMNEFADLSRTALPSAVEAMRPLVHVIDPDDAVRDSLELLLESAGFRVACHRSTDDFLRVPRSDAQACVVIDVGRTPHDGTPFLEALRRRRLEMPVILLASRATSEERAQVHRFGADLVLTKPVHPAVVLHSVRRCLAQARLPRSIPPEPAALPAMLTQRERQVLRMALSGEPNKIIGRKLGISHRTVELHRSNILRKTGSANMLQLASAVGARALLDDVEEGSDTTVNRGASAPFGLLS